VVTGRVRFEDGRPAADAEVRAGEESASGGTPTTTTGVDGRFRLEGVLPEDGSPADLPVWVVASLYGHASDEAPVLLSASLGTPEAHDVGDLVLHTTGCVRGRVVDEEGRSVGGASVRLSCGVREGRTDVAGHYTLACDSWNQTGKTGALWVSAKGFLRTTVRLALLPSPGNVLDAEPVVLSRVAAIQLRVLDARGEPARGVRVRLRSWTDAAERDEDPVTGAGGTVTLDGVAPDDTLELRAEDGGSFTYFVGSSRVVTVRLPATRHLEGRVVDEAGQPIGSARMHLRQQPDGGEERVDIPDRTIEVSGADGTFRLGTVPASAFSVEVSAPGFVTRRVWIAPDATSPLEVVLERFGEAHRRRLVEIQERIGVIESSLARYAPEGHELHLELRDLEEEARRLRGR
ncbi:MAG TPA: carboxypeptidase-like regulatory domain-containing protein, partial [Planctomycetota bacterium]|nr:carboxypeptidase-like regulatory domain-containing protein [Planctomycetota bacterium]